MVLVRRIGLLAAIFLIYAAEGTAQEVKNNQNTIQELEKRIEQLENQEKTRPRVSKESQATKSSMGPSRAFNPAISVNGLFLSTFNSEGNTDSTKEVKTGIKVQELEMRFTGNVDTYLRGDITLAMETTDSIAIEEMIADFLVTRNLSFSAGKFLAPFGKHNRLHTHQFAFVDASLVNEEIFGEEGLNETGMGLNVLLPLPYFSELNLQVLEGDNTTLFNGRLNDDFAYLAHSANLFDLNKDLTLELGGSFAYGKNSFASGPYDHTEVLGADLRFKYKPSGRERYQTLIWQSEFITSSRDQVKSGAYTYLQYQFARRWWVQGRYDFFYEGGTERDKNRWSGALAFVPSEFSTVRLQYNHLNQFATDEHQVFLQLNFTFGSHPAHQY